MMYWQHSPAPLRRDHPVFGGLWWIGEGVSGTGGWVSQLAGVCVHPMPYPPPSEWEIDEARSEQGLPASDGPSCDAMHWSPSELEAVG